MPLLEVNNLTKDFGGIVANENVSFNIGKGEIVGLIGPNGAGKTTLFNCVVGYHRPTQGQVVFNGKDITGLKPFQTNRIGIARTFQIFKMTGNLTVRENIMMAAFCKTSSRHAAKQQAIQLLAFLGLEKDSNELMTDLPVAVQKRIGLGMALATKPILLMLDEVAAGLNPKETEEIVNLLLKIHRLMDISLFLTEHVMEVVMPISHRVIVLDGGQKIAEGNPKDISKNQRVIEAYLGEKYVKNRTN